MKVLRISIGRIFRLNSICFQPRLLFQLEDNVLIDDAQKQSESVNFLGDILCYLRDVTVWPAFVAWKATSKDAAM